MSMKPSARNVEPRAHHFVPRCWLGGFTDTLEKTGSLWATDLLRRKQWPSTPAAVGHRRDFNRLEDPTKDPIVIETLFSKLEETVAPILKQLTHSMRRPSDDELEELLIFVAVQWARVPAFRDVVLGLARQVSYKEIQHALRTRRSWIKWLRQAGIAETHPDADYEAALRVNWESRLDLEFKTDWYLKQAFETSKKVLPSLRSRHWEVLISPKGRFIASDNPVVLTGAAGTSVGFGNADTVAYPVSRHVLLVGTQSAKCWEAVSMSEIAQWNSLVMLDAHEQVYSHVPDFCWMDENWKHQSNWRNFSKERFIASSASKQIR